MRQVTQFTIRRAGAVLLVATALAALSWGYASEMSIEGSFVALLPSENPTAKRFKEATERRAGGSATLIVMASSPNEGRNRTFVDELVTNLAQRPHQVITSIAKGPGEAREFFQKWRWLFASKYDLALLECKIRREREKRHPAYLGLDPPCEETIEVESTGREIDFLSSRENQGNSSDTPAEGERDGGSSEAPSEIERAKAALDERMRALDRYPTGYFQRPDGSLFSVVIRTSTTGMGEFGSDQVLRLVKDEVHRLRPEARGIEVGYAGDIPNAIEQRNALISDTATISLAAVALIFGAIALYFRSFLSLLQIGYCVFVGAGVAFAVAMATYGRLNTATSFLGAIIAGNGINYGIVYLARYRELRTTGSDMEGALVEAATSCRKGTWLAAMAAGGAYLALTVTSFRGFSEFGLIGGVGMVGCWLATFLLLPAQITLVARFTRGKWRVAPTLPLSPAPLGRLVQRRATAVLLLAGAATILAAIPLQEYLSDPWEYDFSKLGSSSSKKKGAGQWSKKANKVFQSRGSPMLILAEDVEHVEAIVNGLRRQEESVGDKAFIDRIETIYDRLGGTESAVQEKLSMLGNIRREIDKALPKLPEDERALVREWRPPDYLRPLNATDLPELVLSEFTESDGRVGTPMYVYLHRGISQSDGHNLLKIAKILEGVRGPDGEVPPNASRSTLFAAMIRAMERDGPLATIVAFLTVCVATTLITRRIRTAAIILGSLICGVVLTVGGAAWLDVRLNFLNFIALPLTFGIGVEYAINVYERIKSSGSVSAGMASIGGPVVLCSLTTILGFGALTFADNMALQSFGYYAMAGELACIFTAMLVMPAALSRIKGGVDAPEAE